MVIRDKPLDSSGFKTLVNLAVQTAVETAKTNLLLTAISYPVSSLLPCFLACPLTKWKDKGTFLFRDNPKVVSSVGYIGEHLTFLT